MSSSHCFLCNENRSICHGVVRAKFLISQRKCYIPIAHTGNFIMYALSPISWKRHAHVHMYMHLGSFSQKGPSAYK